jgi:hypothetical protein
VFDGQLPEEYHIAVEVELRRGKCFTIGLVVGGSPCEVILDGLASFNGLCYVAGAKAEDFGLTHRRVLPVNELSTVDVFVTRSSVLATVEGEPIVRWEGNPVALSFKEMFEEPCLWFGSYGGEYEVSRAELILHR